MRSVRSGWVGAAALGAAILIGSGLSTPPAQAGYIVTLVQQGNDVVATGSGTIDLTGLSFSATSNSVGSISPVNGYIITGSAHSTSPDDVYSGVTGPASFGSGNTAFADSSSGDLVGESGHLYLEVPAGYVSGNPLSDTATYDNQTFSSLGVTPGTYEWTWGSGANQNFTLDIEAVPAPLIGRGLPVLLAVGGLLFGAKLLERSKKHRLQFG